jgi:diaminohydroxyphosphoribosylaminopyrimidine deaminase/5-amino-6-(5-phosphoribosylamino)uracil reductase
MFDDLFPTTEHERVAAEAFMGLALAQARTALGRVAPNPAVGAVVVRDDQVVGRGSTQPPPGRHAEIIALEQAGEAALGASLYVTLEPCSHFGNTPPCVDAIIAAGIRRVVVGTLDPDRRVNGTGIERLRAAGIEVETGCREAEACELIGGFVSRVTTGRPRCTVKYATTLDGKIATRTGHSRWISGPESRELSHILRDRVDAIMAGSGTIVSDDPRLTTRLPERLCGYGGPHHPRRIVIDSRLRTPPDADVLDLKHGAPTIVYCAEDAPEDAACRLKEQGAEIRAMPSRDGHVDLTSALIDLGALGVNDLFVDGGGGLAGALFDTRLVDVVVAFIAPLFVGGDGPSPVAGRGVATMPEAWRLEERRIRQCGDDLMIAGRVVYPEVGHV